MNQEPEFVPGERVVVLQSFLRPELVGSVVEVLSVQYIPRWDFGGELIGAAWGYKTKENSSCNHNWHESQLGKLPPDTPAQFDESIWVPKKEVV